VGVLWMDFPAFMGPSYAERREVGHAVYTYSNGSDVGWHRRSQGKCLP